MTTRPLVPDWTEALSRRTFLKAAAAGVAATTLAACARPPAPEASIISAGSLGDNEEDDMPETSDHYTLSTNEGEAIWFTGTLATIKASGALTGDVFSLVEFLHPPGFSTPLHVHHTADEAFYIIEGAIQGICGDDPWSAETGGFVWLPRGIPHGYIVVGEEPVRTLAMAIPSGFDQFVAEAGDPAQTRTLPPPSEPDFERLAAAAAKYGLEILGPLVLPQS